MECKFKMMDNLQAADDLVEVSKVIFGCERDFMYHKLVQLYRDDQEVVLAHKKMIKCIHGLTGGNLNLDPDVIKNMFVLK